MQCSFFFTLIIVFNFVVSFFKISKALFLASTVLPQIKVKIVKKRSIIELSFGQIKTYNRFIPKK
jgi:hypothetical protein